MASISQRSIEGSFKALPEGSISQLTGPTSMRPCFDNIQNTLINTGREDADRPVSFTTVFFIVLFATKPFVDLTWNFRLFAFGGRALNPLAIVGFCVCMIAGCLHFLQNGRKPIFNKRVIWIFLGLNLFHSSIAFSVHGRSVMYIMDGLTKLFAAYFIYFIGHRGIENDRDKLRIIGIIWITTFLVGILSSIQYSMGNFAVASSQGVERFAGLYNDPGGPSYNAIMSIVFGTLYLELCTRQRQRIRLVAKIAFILTVLVTALILKITLTKSALLMLVVFLTMWIGLYKRKPYVIIPLMILCGYYIYTTSDEVQKRLAPEIAFLRADNYSMELARSMGTGRVATWETVLTYYIDDFDLFERLFGSASTFGTHNQYISYLMQLGAVGLTAFLIILLRFYGRLIYLYGKYKQPDVYMCIVLLTIFVVQGLTGAPFYYTTLLWYLMILLSVINIYSDKAISEASPWGNSAVFDSYL